MSDELNLDALVETPSVTPEVTPAVTPEATPVEAVATPEPIAPAAPSQPSFLDRAAQVLGGRWENEDQLLRDLYRVTAEREQMREYAEFGRQVLPYRSEIQKLFQSQQQPKVEESPQTPSWRHGLENAMVARAIREFANYIPEQQRFVPVDNAPQWARDHLEKYQEWFENHKQRMFSDRADEYIEQMGFVRGDKIREEINKVREEVRNEILQQFAERESEAHARREFTAVHKRIYQHDPSGKPMLDPVGRPMYTNWGKAFHAEVNRLERLGLTNPTEVRRLAEAVASQSEYEKAIATQKIEAEQRRTAQLPPQVSSPATRVPSSTRPDAPITPNMSLGAMLKAGGFGDQDWDEFRQDVGGWLG